MAASRPVQLTTEQFLAAVNALMTKLIVFEMMKQVMRVQLKTLLMKIEQSFSAEPIVDICFLPGAGPSYGYLVSWLAIWVAIIL